MDSDLNFTQHLRNLIRETRVPEKIREMWEDALLYQAADKSGFTLLHYSAQYYSLNLMNYLLDKGCDVDAQDSNGTTPLMIVVEKNHEVVMRILLSAGADIFKLNNENKGALHMLSNQHKMPIHSVRIFLRHLEEKCSTYEEVAEKLHHARCPLYHAVLLKDFKIIEYMINRGSPVNCAHPIQKYTAVHLAVRYEDSKTLMVLLKHGAGVNALDSMNESPLYNLYKGFEKKNSCTKIEILQTLMNQGATMTSCTSEGIFQVHHILMEGNREAIRVLIESGLDFNVKDTGSNRTVLHYLAKNLEPDVVEELKPHSNKFDVDVRDKVGETPLLIAVFNGNVSMVNFLLKQGAKTDVKHRGITPLYYAYERVKARFEERFRQCGELLLHHDADPQIIALNETGEGVTILDAALKTGNIDRIKPVVAHLAMLEKRGTPIRKRIRAKINSHEELKEYFEKCRRLLKEKISGRVSAFDLLSSNSRKMAKYLNNENIAHKLRNETSMRKIMKYQYYFSVLDKRCRKGKTFKKLKTIAARVICDIFENCIDQEHLIIDKVTGYLNDQNLKNLCQVYRVHAVEELLNRDSKGIAVGDSAKKISQKKVSNEREKNLVKK